MCFLRINLRIFLAVAVITLYLTIMPAKANGISCFKCHPAQPMFKETDLLCSQFDGSSKFQVYCPASTLCMKKTIYYNLKSSVIKTEERDCALQKYTDHVYSYIDNEWHDKEEVVETAYEEDCFRGADKDSPVGPPEYCFCSYNLCNSSQPIGKANVYHSLLSIILLLLLRSF